MNEQNVSKLIETHADIIIEQIGQNFQKLHDSVTFCSELKEAIFFYRQEIKTKCDDLFGLQNNSSFHKPYQKDINDIICGDYATIESLTVGLFGDSGSGKTHNLKVIRRRIIENKEQFPLTTIPVFVNVWRFENEQNIILPLLKQLIYAIDDYSKIFNNIPIDLQATIAHLRVVLYALESNNQSPKEMNLPPRSCTSIEASTQSIPQEKLDGIYHNTSQFIEKIALYEKVNFIFLIDDLDRCLPENALKILNSIELYLSIPPCAFVIALNDEIIERGIAHHYKEYQKHYYLSKDTYTEDGKVFDPTLNLPITSDEYIERIIQLPTRLPDIDTKNIREMLTSYGKEWITRVDKNYGTETKPKSPIAPKQSEILLDFFTHAIPPKPRKIKRVSKLFESKLKLLQKLKLQVDLLLLAKITLLELFSPKLLGFIHSQKKYHASLWIRLDEFRFAGKSTELNSLEDFDIIDKYIKKISKTEKFGNMYKKLLVYLKEHYQARERFELDSVFNGEHRYNPNLEMYLKHILELSPIEKHNEKIQKVIYSPNFEKLIFASNDPTAWKDAFKEDNLFAEGKALMSTEQLDKIMLKAKGNGFKKNLAWFTLMAQHARSTDIVKHMDFDMMPLLVTFRDFDKYCDIIGKKKPDDNQWGRGLRPVINVSWEEAVAYAQWKSEEEEIRYRLPTDAEWELACNLGKDTKWHFGNDENMLSTFAWYRNNSNKKTQPVGNKIPNDLGLYDMHGNVWEWCQDDCDIEHNKKIVRGGSWNLMAPDTHTNHRDCLEHRHRYGIVGFRLVRENQ